MFTSHASDTEARLMPKKVPVREGDENLELPDSRTVKAAATTQRREQWVDQVKKVSTLMQKMDEGALKLVHPDHLSWREKSENANVYVVWLWFLVCG